MSWLILLSFVVTKSRLYWNIFAKLQKSYESCHCKPFYILVWFQYVILISAFFCADLGGTAVPAFKTHCSLWPQAWERSTVNWNSFSTSELNPQLISQVIFPWHLVNLMDLYFYWHIEVCRCFYQCSVFQYNTIHLSLGESQVFADTDKPAAYALVNNKDISLHLEG